MYGFDAISAKVVLIYTDLLHTFQLWSLVIMELIDSETHRTQKSNILLSTNASYQLMPFFFSQWRALSHRPWPTTKARSGDHFIMGAPDRLSSLPPMKGRTVLHPCLTRDSNPVPLV